MTNLVVGSVWKCIDEDNQMFNKYCIIKTINNKPEYNGDGTIELLYTDSSKYYGKVRRFIPNVTHVYKGIIKK